MRDSCGRRYWALVRSERSCTRLRQALPERNQRSCLPLLFNAHHFSVRLLAVVLTLVAVAELLGT
ncbi:MAG: hypothetical protein WBP81_17575 [Solirubrobacteraceae bacterium]